MGSSSVLVEAFGLDEALIFDENRHMETLANVEVTGHRVWHKDREAAGTVDWLYSKNFPKALIHSEF